MAKNWARRYAPIIVFAISGAAALRGAAEPRAVLQTDTKGASAVAMSADGRYLASGSPEGEAMLRQLSDDLIVARIGFGSKICALALSSDGSMVAALLESKVVKIAESVSGKEIARLPTMAARGALLFAKDDSALWIAADAPGGGSSLARYLFAGDGRSQYVDSFASPVAFMERDGAGSRIALACAGGELKVFRDGDGSGEELLRRKFASPAVGIAFLGDSLRVLMRDRKCVDVAPGGDKNAKPLPASSDEARRAIFLDDGSKIAFVGRVPGDNKRNHRLSVFDAKTGKLRVGPSLDRTEWDEQAPLGMVAAPGGERVFTTLSAWRTSHFRITGEIAPDRTSETIEFISLDENGYGGRGLRLQYIRAGGGIRSSAVDSNGLSSDQESEAYPDFRFGRIYDPLTFVKRGWIGFEGRLGLWPSMDSLACEDPDLIVYYKQLSDGDLRYYAARKKGSSLIQNKLLLDEPSEYPKKQMLSAKGDILVVMASYLKRRPGQPSFQVIDLASGSRWSDKFGRQAGCAVVSPDGRLVAAGSGSKVILYDAHSGDEKGSLADLQGLGGTGSWIQGLAFDAESRRLAIGKGDSVRVVSAPGFDTVMTVECGEPLANARLSFSKDGRYLYALLSDHLTIVSMADGGIVRFARDERDWLYWTDDGYFEGSRGAGRFLAIVDGARAFGIDQFAAKYNRPDIIMARLGADAIKPDLAAFFKERYAKRLARMGLAEASLEAPLSLPTASIESVSSTGSTASLRAVFADVEGNLARWSVYVNDVPLFGAAGMPLSGASVSVGNSFRLTPGENKIEVSCWNDRGAESLRAMTKVTGPAAASLPDLWFLGFGVSQYANPDLRLAYADKDARDLASAFSAMAGKRFASVHAKTYTNAEVRKESVPAARAFLEAAKEGDVVVLFIAGHGVYTAGSADPDYWYLIHDTDVSRLEETALRFAEVEDLLQGIACRQKLFLMDTCNSGEADQEPSNSGSGPKAATARAIRGLSIVEVRAGSRSTGRPWLEERNRYIQNDLFRRSGAVVLSSSKGGEYSYETDAAQNGLYTQAILDALSSKSKADADRDGYLSLRELVDYVAKSVPAASEGHQHPSVDRDNLMVDFELPFVKPR
jgi:Caspase domain.